jgi:hypothetical protein
MPRSARHAIQVLPALAARLLRCAGTAAAAVAAVAGSSVVPMAVAPAAAVELLVQAVDDDSVFAHVLQLESYTTRRADSPEATRAAAWIASRFTGWGADSVFSQKWATAYAANVVGVRRGTSRPHRIVLVGGHFDSISPFPTAPGADDNASGTACVLECARILCRERFESTLQFAAFSAEELGLVGSNAYAAHLLAGGDTLVAMLNVDMIGYRDPQDGRDLDIIHDGPSRWLYDLAVQTTAQYVQGLPTVEGAYRAGARSDQQSFWNRGYSAISFFEDTDSSSPYIHTLDDVTGLSFNDLELATQSTRAAVALLASLARPVTTPIAVQEIWARRVAGAVEITWRLADPAALRGVGVQRAVEARGPWVEATAALLVPAVSMRFVDASVAAGAASWYRLALHGSTGVIAFAGPIAVDAPAERIAAALFPPIDRGEVGVDVRWSLATSGRAVLAVFDARGRRVRLLAVGPYAAGNHLVTWDRRDDAGAHASRGVYFVHLRAGGAMAARKVVVARD